MAALNVVSVFMLITFVGGNLVHEMKIHDKDNEFGWNNCGKGDSALIAISVLKVTPDPIKFGKNIIVSLTLEVKEDIGSNPKAPINADATVVLEVSGTKVDVCSYAPNYCHYKDVCDLIAKKQFTCPPILKPLGINCKCPLKKKTYEVKDVPIFIPDLPASITGQFNATLKLTEGGKEIGCFSVKFCLDECDSTE